MANKNHSIPIPCRHLVKLAQKRKNANNKGKSGTPTSVIRCTPESTKAYNRLLASEVTRRDKNGSFYRLRWSTPAEREAERIALGI